MFIFRPRFLLPWCWLTKHWHLSCPLSPLTPSTFVNTLRFSGSFWRVTIKMQCSRVYPESEEVWFWVSYSPWLRTSVFCRAALRRRRGLLQRSLRAAGSRGEQTVPDRELCFSYQQTLALSKQVAAIVASVWEGGGTCWRRKGVRLGRFKGAGDF